MITNDVMRQLRYAMNYNDDKMLELLKSKIFNIEKEEYLSFLKKEEEEGFAECPKNVLSEFLDAFIEEKRGVQENKPATVQAANPNALNNNLILRKIRIALELKEEDMLAIFQLGNFRMAKSEISALFRAPSHRNYKKAGDQVLRYFMRGLVKNYRG